jgi:Flp pilus assembly protein TadD
MPAKQRKARSAKRELRLTTPPLGAPKPNGFSRWSNSRTISIAGIVLLCLLAVTAYGNALGNGFVWDDHQQVVMNSSLQPDAPFSHLFAANIWGLTRKGAGEQANYYRPLQMVAYRLTADLFGFDSRAFHAVNLAFHVIVVLLVLSLFYILTGSKGLAFAAAALFAVHPVHAEPVDWIAGLPDIACTAFFVLAFLLFFLSRDSSAPPHSSGLPRRVRLPLLAASYSAFAIALLWKESAIALPIIVAMYVLYVSDDNVLARRISQALKVSLPYWGILGLYFLLRLRVLGFLVTRQRNWILTPLEFVLTTLNLISAYCWKLLAPIRLNAYYVFSPVRSIADPRAIAAVLLIVIAAGAVIYGMRRAPLASFVALWVFITLIPVLDMYAVGRNVFAERYLYMPSVGFCLLVALAASWVGRRISVRLRAPVAGFSLAAVLLLFTVETRARNAVWKDDLTLFTHTLESSPTAPFVHNMVAAQQPNSAAGQASAEAHYQNAAILAKSETPPDRLELAIAEEGLAMTYAARGDFDRALSALAQVRAVDPRDPEVDGEEGLILTQAGRWTEAEAALRRAVVINPHDANVLNSLGLIAWQHGGHLEQAVAYFSRALQVHTEADDFNASLHSNLGAVYGQQNRFSEALEQFRIALQISPRDPEYLTNLATAFAALNRLDDARRAAQTALSVAPDYGPAHVLLQQIGTK